MKDVLRNLKKRWITVWLVVVAAMLIGTFISRAVYTEVSSVKRVVTTRSSPKELFSSNCMFPDLIERRMPSNEYNVDVRNFDPNNPDTPNPNQIEYTLTAQLQVKYNGNVITMDELKDVLGKGSEAYAVYAAKAAEYQISKTQDQVQETESGTFTNNILLSPQTLLFSDYSDDNYTVVFNSETLPGGSISVDRFKITVPLTDFEDKGPNDPEFYIYVKADPTDNGLTDIQTYLYGSKNSIVTAFWSGSFAESDTSTHDYDFYNYIITGSGSGKLDIMWDSEWFEVNDFFFDSSLSGVTFDQGNIDGEGKIRFDQVSGKESWLKVTIIVDSTGSDSKSRYELQLYKKKPNTPYTGSNDAANYIDCKLQDQNNST